MQAYGTRKFSHAHTRAVRLAQNSLLTVNIVVRVNLFVIIGTIQEVFIE